MKVAVVGATGLVGTRMIKVLEERNFPVTELIPAASERSAGKKITFRGREYTVVTPDKAIEMKPQLAIFSAGSDASKEYAPKFAAAGCYVVDNSACWRMDPTKKLVIPEINADVLEKNDMIIANPNCSTIQMLIAIADLHKKYKIKRLVVSTYQCITGTGQKAVDEVTAERKAWEGPEKNIVDGYETKAYPYQIDLNLLPHIDKFLDNGYTKEEMKMVNETHKILDKDIKVSPTTVRAPVLGGHSESVNLEFERPFKDEDIIPLLKKSTGVIVQDNVKPSASGEQNPSIGDKDIKDECAAAKAAGYESGSSAKEIPALEKLPYPMPLYSEGRDEVFVGRIRRDPTLENGLNLWCVSDNLRKGAATNAVQIAEALLAKGFIK
ncbi:MAG: aspartate-semialdehyde dehydrogenase [Bacteroidales bacterium]|jgi:aspartate-semialdehyde dehydrogenase|nr:aspartate-semialdehyde dehydrogenase [Bacteroidales bacterium]